MFLNHSTAFADITPVSAAAPSATFSAQTRVETPRGWLTVDALQAGDGLATLDGGWAEITAIRAADPTTMVHIPGGTLNTCSDIVLPAHTRVGLELPARWSQHPIVSAPLKALCGWRGIRPSLFAGPDLVSLEFADEEMVYAQTGLMIHAAPATDSFFPMRSYGDTRALLTLQDGQFKGPDRSAA